MKRLDARTLTVATALVVTLAIAGLGQRVGTHDDFDLTAVIEEAYWYSRYNLGHLTMRAGMGDTFMPDMEMVEMMIAMADADPADGDIVSPPMNPALLKSVFASGEPFWTQPAAPSDFATLRWDPSTFDTRVTGSALGWTILKELEWAKQFHIDWHFGTVDDDFGAQWRFMGLVLTAMAEMQALDWIERHAAGEMTMVDKSDPFVMLMALSSLADVLGADAMPHSRSNRYYDPESAALFRRVANEQFDRVVVIPSESMTVKELATAIQGLVWYASITADQGRHRRALDHIATLGELLRERSALTAAAKGYAIRGLIEVFRVLDDRDALNAADRLVEELSMDYDEDYGIFRSQLNYSIDDVAAIVGGLNAAMLHGDVHGALAEKLLVGFFEAAVNLSGLQLSAPPAEAGKSAFELGAPDLYYRYPTLPLPGEVGDYGVAPVTASSVAFDPSSNTWTVTNTRFDTAGAMHAANEFIWLHANQVNGFPIVGERAHTEPMSAQTEERTRLPLLVRLIGHVGLVLLVALLVTMIRD